MQRILDISSNNIFLKIENGLLVVESKQLQQRSTVPLAEILAVVLSSQACTLTHAVLAELAVHNIPFISCGKNFVPTGIQIPFEANSLQGERFWKQAQFNRREDLWFEVVQAKIKNSISVLLLWKLSTFQQEEILDGLVGGKLSPQSAESFSARMYFEQIFESGFTRRDSGHPENARLNYGYTILRSATIRFLCGSGLHPTFGIHHRNKYNAFALADDLMEPFRPFVDHLVLELVHGNSMDSQLQPECKLHLAGGMFVKWQCESTTEKKKVLEVRSLADWLERSVRACAQFILGETQSVPKFPFLKKPEEFDF
jgi:CRISP-associated protein Cas1